MLIIKIIAAFCLAAYLLEKMVDDAAFSKWLDNKGVSHNGNVSTEHVAHSEADNSESPPQV